MPCVHVGLDAGGWRTIPLDGALLRFHRDSGTNVRIDDDRFATLRQQAPRVVQFAITNRCNLACGFCSRDVAAPSDWSADDAVAWLSALATAGVLEVAFGGGEPWTFPGFDALIRRLHAETPLAVSFTTNGLWITRVSTSSSRAGVIRSLTPKRAPTAGPRPCSMNRTLALSVTSPKSDTVP